MLRFSSRNGSNSICTYSCGLGNEIVDPRPGKSHLVASYRPTYPGSTWPFVARRSLSGLKQLIQEVHRRSLWQVLLIYIAAGWVVFEIVQTVTEGLGLPTWFYPAAVHPPARTL